ncbi:serine/threonine protein kinase [Anabaenopsis tanganyikae CS-531]|uniref:Serine/threonine-protein kinase n=2 Tax=Anabaenopsis TaxID=110103 RepID=A0ABT5ANX2_9CYAN|nr:MULTISPECIES: serine/threonine-protein kinase [Anabaenopsis]MDB9539026.1 serine/threonine-protein kinase [Anabaenopsis arnoldii]MDH6091315.1 serine/threonine protein kinase [Anabaenopsis arnoldii]MDH6105212.1 serine/threonine protein kinase [Anabaenopsis tanganyikae CS-531]
MISEILGDRYEVQQLLGKKSGRRTFLARDKTTGELVVVKLLSFSSDFEWDDLKLFEREAKILKSLSHPAIPSYLDYFEVNLPKLKGFALVQSYISGQTLEQYIKVGRTFTESEIKQVATELLEILIYLHGMHPPVIHRDIKPSNILLGERSAHHVGQVYLVDFGSVQNVLDTEAGTRTVVGTYGYMPPEQFGGRTVPTSDLYSLGATLIYLVSGNHPADLPQKDFRIQFEQVTHLSPGLTRWLRWMTEPTLERRPSSALEALKALNESDLKSPLPLNMVKPVGSKIQLSQDWDHLEILIPSAGWKFSMLFSGLFGMFLFFGGFVGTIGGLFTINFFVALQGLMLWGMGYFILYYCLFDSLFRRTRLRFDEQQMTFTDELFGFKWHRFLPAPRENITKIAYIPRYVEDAMGDILHPAKLEIWVGVTKYPLSVNHGAIQSEAELEWLAHELSHWLNIPIEKA